MQLWVSFANPLFWIKSFRSIATDYSEVGERKDTLDISTEFGWSLYFVNFNFLINPVELVKKL